MSKVFNKKRIKSIKSTNYKRYFIYAFGEVIIIVIGIFIAIYFNYLQTEKKKKKYVNDVIMNIES
jgi:hypothetical protein